MIGPSYYGRVSTRGPAEGPPPVGNGNGGLPPPGSYNGGFGAGFGVGSNGFSQRPVGNGTGYWKPPQPPPPPPLWWRS